ncbi:FeoA family protein [Sphingomonas nostoxanthinifaciens]|uniref:FeoA family protein n=1 Tax=Sphingomonas nostoxanthinifaciens TaxID=2872652 RepID=UPI001CC1EA6E|nr:FeoA family protein [Sphingomonas nostoxanthinifaciens]
MRLDQLPPRHPSRIAAIDWASVGEREGKRLRELGFDHGVAIEALHHGAFQGPIACRVGRMTIALRRRLAASVTVEPA